MTSPQQFSPLCDLHHTSMQRMMLKEDSEESLSCYACARHDCTRVFREAAGYLDYITGEFDDSRTSVQSCPQCGSILYLAEVDHFQKIETWNCPQGKCAFSGHYRSPSAR